MVSIMGQYLHFLKRLHGLLSTLCCNLSNVLVEALTKWSARFLFLRLPKTNLASLRALMVFDLSRSNQFDSTISLRGGLDGLCVVIR